MDNSRKKLTCLTVLVKYLNYIALNRFNNSSGNFNSGNVTGPSVKDNVILYFCNTSNKAVSFESVSWHELLQMRK